MYIMYTYLISVTRKSLIEVTHLLEKSAVAQ